MVIWKKKGHLEGRNFNVGSPLFALQTLWTIPSSGMFKAVYPTLYSEVQGLAYGNKGEKGNSEARNIAIGSPLYALQTLWTIPSSGMFKPYIEKGQGLGYSNTYLKEDLVYTKAVEGLFRGPKLQF